MKISSKTINSKQILLLIGVMFVLLISLQVGYRLSYSWGYPPITSLIIDETSFPSGWVAGEIDTDFPPLAPCSTGREETGYATRSFYFDSPSGYVGGASIVLERFRNPSVASRNYDMTSSHEFRDTDWNTPWVIPEDLTFTSLAANQYRYACSLEGDPNLAKPVCILISQYEVYVIQIHIGLHDTNTFTYKDIVPIFEAIEYKMSHQR